MERLRTQSIERWRKAYRNEWLLIEVDRFDPRTTTPLSGRLVAHSKRRDPLEQRAARAKGLVYLVHGSDTLPRGYAAAF